MAREGDAAILDWKPSAIGFDRVICYKSLDDHGDTFLRLLFRDIRRLE